MSKYKKAYMEDVGGGKILPVTGIEQIHGVTEEDDSSESGNPLFLFQKDEGAISLNDGIKFNTKDIAVELFAGDVNGVDKKYILDENGDPLYPFFIITGYKEWLPEPNVVSFVFVGNQLKDPTNATVRLSGGENWDYYLRCNYDNGLYYFYSTHDWSGNTVFRVTAIWGV